MGLVNGDRRDETATHLRQIEERARALDEQFIRLQAEPDLTDIVNWIFEDDTVLTLVRARLER